MFYVLYETVFVGIQRLGQFSAR